jgi:type IV secretory pathway VirB4 component
VSFLRDLLPVRAEPRWETAVVAAVDRVISHAREPTCLDVVRALEDGDETEAQVGAVLSVYARSGLTQLGFADPAVRLPPVGQAQVTYLPIRDLPGPDPGMRRSEYSQAERVGEQLVRLIAMFAMHLMGSERERLKLFSFDEGWRLLGDPAGRALLASLQRMGRSELAVPIISTQLVTDALVGERESLENLIGATFVFGMRSEAEAARALALVGLDPDDAGLRRTLLELEGGRCLLRDHRGRIEAIQVDVVVPSLLRALSTTPQRA